MSTGGGMPMQRMTSSSMGGPMGGQGMGAPMGSGSYGGQMNTPNYGGMPSQGNYQPSQMGPSPSYGTVVQFLF